MNSTHCAYFTICVCKSSLDIAVSLVANCWQCRLLVPLPHLSIYIYKRRYLDTIQSGV